MKKLLDKVSAFIGFMITLIGVSLMLGIIAIFVAYIFQVIIKLII